MVRNLFICFRYIITDNSNSSTPILSMRDTPSNNTNTLFADGVNPSAIHIAIDWDPTALHLRYQSTREKVSDKFKLN